MTALEALLAEPQRRVTASEFDVCIEHWCPGIALDMALDLRDERARSDKLARALKVACDWIETMRRIEPFGGDLTILQHLERIAAREESP